MSFYTYLFRKFSAVETNNGLYGTNYLILEKCVHLEQFDHQLQLIESMTKVSIAPTSAALPSEVAPVSTNSKLSERKRI